jgi:hypothetical protein
MQNMPHQPLRVVDSDLPPADLVARAKAAFSNQRDGALVALVADSLVDDNEPATDHLLCFEHRELRIEARLSVGADGTSLAGRVTPSMSGRVDLQFASGNHLVEQMLEGEFAFAGVDHGVIRLHLLGGHQSSHFRTDWFHV